MYLGGIKKRLRYSVVHELGKLDLPNQLPEDQLSVTIEAHKKGNNKAREDLILTHIRLTLQISAGYTNRYPKRKDDIVSAAMLGLVEAVDRARTCLYNNNISAYITTVIHSHIHKYILTDHLIQIPQHKVKEMLDINILPYTQRIRGEYKESDDEENTAYTNEGESSLVPPIYDEDPFMVTDFVNQLNAVQAKILSMRLDGMNDVEISKVLELSKERVRQIREEIKEIFVRRMGYET